MMVLSEAVFQEVIKLGTDADWKLVTAMMRLGPGVGSTAWFLIVVRWTL